jgi:hypothetical protein
MAVSFGSAVATWLAMHPSLARGGRPDRSSASTTSGAAVVVQWRRVHHATTVAEMAFF